MGPSRCSRTLCLAPVRDTTNRPVIGSRLRRLRNTPIKPHASPADERTGDLSMAESVYTRQPWSHEVAARLRSSMIAFVAVLLLSMVTTIGYIAGRTLPASQSRDPVVPAKFWHAAPAPRVPLQLSSPRPTEPPMPVPRQRSL